MEHICQAAGHESLFVHAIQETNRNQKRRFAEKIGSKLAALSRRHDRRLGPGVQGRHR